MNLTWILVLASAVTGLLCVLGSVLFGLAGAIVPAIGGTVLSFWLGRKLAGDIELLGDTASRIISSDFRFRAGPAGPPEVRRIAQTLNVLAERAGQRIADEAAEHSRLSSILNAMSEGIIVVDQDGIVESANPAAAGILGAPASFKHGQRLTSLTGNFLINQAATECARSGLPRQAQVELYLLSSARKFVQVNAVPLAQSGARRRALVLVNDLTDVRRVEVTRREFISNASHELRTPIASIKATLETLQRGAISDPEARTDFMRRMEADIERMDYLVREMLELSRLESGHTPFHLAPVDPVSLIEAAARRFSPLMEERGLSIAVDIGRPLPLVNADREQMERVLSNLVSNAMKFTPEKGRITLTARREDGNVCIAIRDTGAGIAAEHLQHIFERFYKADEARSGGGTGLGLAIAKHIIQAHGGTITASSTPGAGSEFTVTLPALAVRDD